MFTSPLHDDRDPFVTELLEFSTKALSKKQESRSPAPAASQGPEPSQYGDQSEHWADSKLDLDHAAPLMPLRKRDLVVLAEMFEHDQIEAIEADVIRNLLIRWPEPCWEDEPLEFLSDYL